MINLSLLRYFINCLSTVRYKYVAQDENGLLLSTHTLVWDPGRFAWGSPVGHATITYLPKLKLKEFDSYSFDQCLREISYDL